MGSTRAWRKLRAQVIAEEPTCRIQTAGICTVISTEADHIAPKSIRPDLAMSRANLRGSCLPCNRHRGNGTNNPTPAGRPTITVITGPPAAGKSTWVKQHAKPGDITIDYDAIANTLTPPHGSTHEHQGHIKAVTKAARQAAIDAAIALRSECHVYIIHSTPSPALLAHYKQHGATITVIDPGRDTVLARCKAERPWQLQRAVEEWYATNRHIVTEAATEDQASKDFFAC